MHKFKVQPDWYDIADIDDRPTTDARDAKDAAEKYVDLNFAKLDYPTGIAVVVKNEHGQVSKWDVDVDTMPVFRATESAPARKASDSQTEGE